MEKTFLLGIGAQKAGTTWLHDQLSAQAFADFGAVKEYHVFDTLHAPEGGAVLANLQRQLSGEVAKGGLKAFTSFPELWHKASFLADQRTYFAYFLGLVSQPEGPRLTGDITPTYGQLPEEVLAGIRSSLLAAGLAVRVIYMMRDPVDRCWSALRMRRRVKLKHDPGATFHLSEEEALLSLFDKGEMGLHTRYDEVIAKVQKVFAPEEVLFAQYETFFTPASMDRLSAFLGTPPIIADFARRPNATEKTGQLSEDTVRTISRHFAPAYAAARSVLPAGAVDAAWSSARFV